MLNKIRKSNHICRKLLGTALVLLAVLPSLCFAETYAFPFIGKWNPSETPVLIDEYGFQDIQNMRKDGKHLRGVGGHTKVNSNTITNNRVSGIYHYRKSTPYAESHVLLGLDDGNVTSPGPGFQYSLYENTTAISTLISTPSDFDSTAIYTNTLSAADTTAKAAFALAPQDTLLYSDEHNLVAWGGDESNPLAIFLSDDTSEDGNATQYFDVLKDLTTDDTGANTAVFGNAFGDDTYAVLLLHMDGTDEGTTFTDDSASAHTVTANGDANTETSYFKFGTASGEFDSGGDDYLSVPDSADWAFGSGDFTISAEVYPLGGTTKYGVLGQAVDGNNFMKLSVSQSSPPVASVNFIVLSGGAYICSLGYVGALSAEFHNIEVDRSGSNWYLFVDGDLKDTYSNATAYPDLAATFDIGRAYTGVSYNYFQGYVDEVLVSKGVARHTSSFTPPSVAFYDDSSAQPYILIGSPYILKGLKFYIDTPNPAAGALTGKVLQSGGWNALTLTDNTSSGGVTMAQTGTVTWTPSANDITDIIQNFDLYWYEFYLSSGTVGLKRITMDYNPQSVANVWDGADTPVSAFVIYKNAATTTISGTHTVGFDNLPYLVRSGAFVITSSGVQVVNAPWVHDSLVGRTLTNTTDGSSCTISANYEYLAYCSSPLSGGTDNDFDGGDQFTITNPISQYQDDGYSTYLQSDDVTSTVELSSLTTSDVLYVGFAEPVKGINVRVTPKNDNSNASVATIYYRGYNGWVQVPNAQGELVTTPALSTSGLTHWGSIGKGLETEYVLGYGDKAHIPLFYYKITFSGALDGTTEIYNITGIRSVYPIENYAFAEQFANRAWLFNQTGGEHNLARYSAFNAPYIYNGSDSGFLRFGSGGKLTAAHSLYNVFQNTGYNQLIITKENETWRLLGTGPENWEIFNVSTTTGCIARRTMVMCDVGHVGEGTQRQVLIWLSASGVVQFDGAKPKIISDDIRTYWDKNSSNYITPANMAESVGWYDPNLRAYKLLLGGVNGVELEYSLLYEEWTKLYREDGSGADPLIVAAPMQDTNGAVYTFGANEDAQVYYLESGSDWAGAADITYYVWTKDLQLDDKAPLFHDTSIEHVRLLFNYASTTDTISFQHYCDGTATTDGVNDQLNPASVALNSGPDYTTSVTLGRCKTHSMKISATTDVANGLELNGLGMVFESYDTISE